MVQLLLVVVLNSHNIIGNEGVIALRDSLKHCDNVYY